MVGDDARVATNAAEVRFDEVEIHCASVCLLDRFMEGLVNYRANKCRDSVDDCSGFTIEVAREVLTVA